MKTIKMIEKRNGKMTKRETIRAMYVRAIQGDSSCIMSFSYMARRLGFDVKGMIQFMNWMKINTFVNFVIDGRNIVFTA